MSAYKDWFPGPRTLILAMCQVWISYLTTERRTAWGIPAQEFTDLGTLFAAAQALLQKSRNDAVRTHVITVQLEEAFGALEAKMRFFRKHYFLMPPLTLEDWVSLGFDPPDVHPTPVPPPDGTPSVSLSYSGGGPHIIMAHLGPMAGTRELDPRSGYGYAVYRAIMPPGGATLEEAASPKHYLMAPPLDGRGLDHQFTRRRKEELIFDAEDAGKTACVCARYENSKGEAGKAWSPVVSAIIP